MDPLPWNSDAWPMSGIFLAGLKAVSEEEDKEDSAAMEDGITSRGSSSSSRQRRELSW